MSQDRKEQLYDMLFDVLSELTEHEGAEIIFDRIVDNFAAMIEYHTAQTDTFSSMLNTFRHSNPSETIPEDVVDSTHNVYEEMYGGISDINRQYMLEDRDNLMEFLKTAHFPDTI